MESLSFLKSSFETGQDLLLEWGFRSSSLQISKPLCFHHSFLIDLKIFNVKDTFKELHLYPITNSILQSRIVINVNLNSPFLTTLNSVVVRFEETLSALQSSFSMLPSSHNLDDSLYFTAEQCISE